jgi:hypothetical protein
MKLTPTSIILKTIATVIGVAGLAINAWFARNLGATEIAGLLFVAVGMAADAAAFVLPTQAGNLWRSRQRLAAATAWTIWTLTFAFALIASVGFAALNIADTTMSRAGRTTPEVILWERTANTAASSRQAECAKRGPLCRDREADERRALDGLKSAQGTVAADSDPQITAASHLVTWASRGMVTPSTDDLGMIRLLLLTVLPQLGGLVLMVATGQASGIRHQVSRQPAPAKAGAKRQIKRRRKPAIRKTPKKIANDNVIPYKPAA